MSSVLSPASGSAVSAMSWTARFVAPLSDQGVGTPASFVEMTFRLDRVPADAVLHISALGLYRCFINGTRVGNDLLTPGWTSYDKRLSFQTYPVADLLKAARTPSPSGWPTAGCARP